MKTFIKATVITLALGLTSIYASGSHSHGNGHSHTQKEVSQKTIKGQANQVLSGLIKKGKINKSWAYTPIKDMKKKQFHHNMEWVVSYENKKIQNKMEQTLYIFISLTGEATGVNYTGK